MNTRYVSFIGLASAITTLLACSGGDGPQGASHSTLAGGAVGTAGGAFAQSPASGGAPATFPTGTPTINDSLGGGATTTSIFPNTGGSTAMVEVSGAGSNSTLGGASTGGGATSTGGNDSFTLAWEDDFSTLNGANWALQSFTWDGNLATFSPKNATVADGILRMSLSAAPDGAEKPYLGVEARSKKTITYGKISARMRFAAGSGVVSGLVLFYTPYPNCDWNEIDIEHLGKSPLASQLNAMVYKGTYNPDCTTSVKPTQEPLVTDLGFNAESDFHLYDIEWTPSSVKYFADGVLLRTWSKNISLLKRPMNILLTIWASDSSSWAGPVEASSIPTTAELDWIKVYTWNG